MKKHYGVLIVEFLVGLCLRFIAFIKEIYVPLRDFRLEGFKQMVVARVSAAASSAKSWMYAMFSRWHIDSPAIA